MGLTGNTCEVVAGLPGLGSAWPKAQIHVRPRHEPCAATSTTGSPKSSLGGAAGPHRPLSPTFLCDSGGRLCFQATPQQVGGGIREPGPPQAGEPPLEWLLAPTAGARCVLWPLARWRVDCRAEPRCCEMGEKVEELLCRRVWP